MIDAVDQAAGLTPDDKLYHTRRFRPEFVQGAEQCRLSVLQPENDLGLPAAFRLAVARRIAALNNDAYLTADYDAQLARLEAKQDQLALAAGSRDLPQPLATIARHVDLVTCTPKEATASDIRLLEQAGLDNPQIVALSELIAFVNFTTRVATGLRLMRSA